MVIGHHLLRDHSGALDRLVKEGRGTLRVAVLTYQELDDLPAGQRVSHVPAHRSKDHVHQPAIPAEGRDRVVSEVASTGPAGILLAAPTIATVALAGGLLAGGAGRHEGPTLTGIPRLPKLIGGQPERTTWSRITPCAA